jgi:hypothetical protein
MKRAFLVGAGPAIVIVGFLWLPALAFSTAVGVRAGGALESVRSPLSVIVMYAVAALTGLFVFCLVALAFGAVLLTTVFNVQTGAEQVR